MNSSVMCVLWNFLFRCIFALMTCLLGRTVPGGPAPDMVRAHIAHTRALLPSA